MSPVDAANARLEVLEKIFEECDVKFMSNGTLLLGGDPHDFHARDIYVDLTEAEWESLTPLMPEPIPYPEKKV